MSTSILNCRTQAQHTPLGIDCESPTFSWQMAISRTGAKQTAYRIVVSKDESLTTPIWDSTVVKSEKQHIALTNPSTHLEPCTRYYWKVFVWDEENTMHESETTWFESGLMGKDASVWNNAQWIGSPRKTTNTDCLYSYQMTVDFKTDSGNRAGIVLSARNKDNYVLFDVDMDNRTLTIYEYCDNAWDGSTAEGHVPTVVVLGNNAGYTINKDAVSEGCEHDWNTISITVDHREASVSINNVTILDKVTDLMPNAGFFVPRRACLFSVGFKQLCSTAYYDNLVVSDPKTNTVFQEERFSDESGIFSVLGTCKDGILTVKNQFELACPVPAVNLLGTFHADASKEIASARLYATARGSYRVKVNGVDADDSFFAPGFTDYRLRIFYQTYDVTKLLHEGDNQLLAVVGKGYYSGYCGYSGPMKYGEQNSFLGRLIVTYTDGSKDELVTDDSWLFTDKSAVVDSDYLDGENYDARLLPQDLTHIDNDDHRWITCGILPWPGEPVPTNGTFSHPVSFELTAQEGPSAVVERVLTPVSMQEIPSGHFVYDLGQNMVGTVRLHLKGARGLSIKLRYGEMSYANGEIYIKNIRSAANTDTYTFNGNENGEVFVPSFTSHGFRYVEITGNGCMLSDIRCVERLEGLVLCNTPDTTGSFACSDPLVNQLQSNIQWGQRGNSLLVYTDCPQRNERMGWTGDAQVFAPTAAFNMDVQSFMNKWLLDVRDGQLMYNREGAVPDTAPLGGDNRPAGCAGWADASVIVPWEMYLAYGDTRVLEDNYECMARWIAYQSLDSRQNCGLRTVDGIPRPNQSDLSTKPFLQVQQSRGDHLTFDESTPFILTATAYAAYVADLMSRIAAILGKPEDAALYKKRFEDIRTAFQEAWVQPDGSLAYWGEMSKGTPQVDGTIINQTRYSEEAKSTHHPSQTAYALAIDFNLMPEKTMDQTIQYFAQSIHRRDDHLSVGFLGISHLLPALTKCGQTELAFTLLEQKGNPGWLYSVINGATTIWERWNSYIAETGTFGDVSMNSFNHYAYGSIGQWLYRTVLGIQTGESADEAGYHRIFLAPFWGGTLTFAKGEQETPFGKVASSWEKKDGSIVYRCTIPANTTARLTLPVSDPRKIQILEGAVMANSAPSGVAVFELVSGSYAFRIQ